ncbi:hypothetical protein SMU66_04859 [Streptococcus mutans N34]|nr:hypothetical protein SMU66_04859 [Streptococcus mutans N34]
MVMPFKLPLLLILLLKERFKLFDKYVLKIS